MKKEFSHKVAPVFWFTGLPASGKSTLANAFSRALTAQNSAVEHLDGDDFRANLSPELSFTRVDRIKNNMRMAYVARLLARHGIVVLISAVSPYSEARNEAKRMLTTMLEIHVATPIDVCMKRDKKGLYLRALRHEIPMFTGISDPYETPLNADMTLDMSQHSVEEAVAMLMKHCLP